MMEVFTKVERGYWQDEFILELTPEQKFFYLYLMSNSKVNTLGAYVFPMTMSTLELGYNRETVKKLLDHFVDAGKIMYDETTNEVFLLNWPKRNWNKRTATLRALKKDVDALKSPVLREKISAMLSAFCGGEDAIDDTEEQKGTNGNNEEQKGTNGDNEDILDGRKENREKRIENREKEKEKEDAGTVFDAAAAFEIFYKAYPNKKNVKTARTRWEKMKVTPELFAAIMEGLERAKNSHEWAKDDSAYIPHPATWLNGEGWKNEYKPLRQAAAPKAPAGNMPDPLAERRRMMGGGAV